MTDDLDRFDRMLLASEGRAASSATAAPSRAAAAWGPRLAPPLEPRRATDPPPRPPRYVDYTDCPMCDAVNLGIEFHGELMSGAKVHTLSAHSANKRSVANGQPRCLGAGLRVVFEGGIWKGMAKP